MENCSHLSFAVVKMFLPFDILDFVVGHRGDVQKTFCNFSIRNRCLIDKITIEIFAHCLRDFKCLV